MRLGVMALRQETYLPDSAHQVAQIHEFLAARDAAAHVYLVGAEPEDRVELTAEIRQALRYVVSALHQGHAVAVAPVVEALTTQQAADLLGVSRPTVIKLLDEGKIPVERNGTHRRVFLRDLLAYREGRRAEQYAALEATSVSVTDEDDLDVVLQALREARKAVAANRAPKTSI